MYRAVTLIGVQQNIDPEDDATVTRLAHSLDMRLVACDSGDRLLVNGDDVTDHLRDTVVERNVSLVSRIYGVRTAMVQQQRTIAQQGSIVMVGRDIGTVVLPDANLKIYLKASVEVRAQRRHKEIIERGSKLTLNEVLEDLKRRDKLDTERENSPLKPAPDAVKINTDSMSIESVAGKILALVKLP
jgi:cytidylate kinase